MQQPPPGYGPPRPGMINMMQPPMGFSGAPLFNMGPPQMAPPGTPAPRLNIIIIITVLLKRALFLHLGGALRILNVAID